MTYFNGSVLGLTEESPVTYRGVPVGQLEKIEIAPDGKQIKVLFRLYRDFILEEKMVAQLEPLGFYGALVLGLDNMKQDEVLVIPNRGNPVQHFVILSRPPNFPTMGDLYDLIRKMDEVLEQMRSNSAE